MRGRGNPTQFYVYALLRFRGNTDFAANSLSKDTVGVVDVFVRPRSRERHQRKIAEMAFKTVEKNERWLRQSGGSGRGVRAGITRSDDDTHK